MTVTQEKRPAEALENEQTKKKQQIGEDVGKEDIKHIDKGVAPIKPEYIIRDAPAHEEEYLDDDNAEAGDRAAGDKDNKKEGKNKKRGQNKKRDLRQQHEEIRLCPSLVNPEDDSECKYGEDACRNTHDIELYLSSKPEDIPGVCPVFKAIGYCPSGLKCRWLNSHYDNGKKQLPINNEQAEVSKRENFEVNKLTQDTKTLLQRKKYNFETSDKVIPFIDSLVQKEDGDDDYKEKRKENFATSVDGVYRVAEKKRLHLDGAKVLSPLTTVGNLPYRRLMKTLGADVTYSEMALSVPLVQGTNSEWALPKAHVSEYPGFGVQIASSKNWSAAKAAEAIYKEAPYVSELNLNCGCPIDLLYRQGQGSALLEQPARLLRLLKTMNACSGDIPVTVKLRTGTKENKNTAKTAVERILKEGDAAAITLHGRSRQQRYTKEADWSYIADVGKVVKEWNEQKEESKEAETQPTYFVGNGDVYSHEDWHNAVNMEGIDTVMVARGALIKPWIFEEVNSHQYLDKSASERLEILKTFAYFALEHWGSDEYGVNLARRFMCEFLSFTHRYIPVGILERLPTKINQRPPKWRGRNELETLLASSNYKDWIKITEMFLGKASENFQFAPKHKSNAY